MTHARGPILVLDDDPDILRILGSVIERMGREVLPAADPRTALALCKERHPSLAFVDLMLPHMDGEAFIAQLRASGLETLPKIVIISASAIREEVAIRLDIDAVVPKPFDLEEVRELIERLEPES